MPARRSSLLLVAATAALGALLGSSLAAPAQARVPAAAAGTSTDDPRSEAALDALRNVRGLLDGALPGTRGLAGLFGPAEQLTDDATMALRELALTKDLLGDEARAEAETYLARPTDSPGPGNNDISYSVKEAPASPACVGPVCVHWVAASDDAPPLTDANPLNGVPDYVDVVLAHTRKVHNTYVKAGYRAPKGDGKLGGSSQTDIYIADIGGRGLYGYCPSDQPIPRNGPYNAWAYCVVDNDYNRNQFPTKTPLENLQVTLAHEYFHAVQFNYDITEDSWFLEGTAAWVEDEVYDHVDDNRQYLTESPLRMPRIPLDTFGGSFHYGTWIFFRYLSERYPAAQGGLPTIVRDMIRKTDGSAGARNLYSMQAVKAVLKARRTNFPKTFAKFSNANRRPAQTYSEGRVNKYPKASLLRKFRLGRGQTRGDEFFADHLTSGTVRFTPATSLRARNAKLRLQVGMAPARRGSAAVAAIKLRSGKVRMVTLRIGSNGSGGKTVPFSARTVKYVELTLANAGTNYACANSGPYSCRGTSKNENVRETYRGRVRVG